MRRITYFYIALFFALPVAAQQVNIIPQPVSIKQPRINADFNISPATQIVLEGSGLETTARFLNDYLQQFYLFKLKVVKNSGSTNTIRLNYERMDNAIAGAYRMEVDGKGVYIAGDNAAGVFYGMQTLIQLLPVPDARLKMRPANLKIGYINIEDAPRFQYRGMHLDVSRHFFPVSFIKKYIDYLAYHKLNIFHWHLTEDQGWRIEIKKYPELTKVGGWRNGTIIGRYPGKGSDNLKYGGSYSQAEIKEVVKYAKDRFIDVIPEIEMPGHSSAAIAAYPWLSCFPEKPTAIPANMISKKSVEQQAAGKIKLVQETWGVFDDVFCAGNDSTFTFLQNVIDEVITLFPSQYFHIGGDECPKTHWKICPDCQKRMKDNNLKDEHELQSYFVQRIEKYLNRQGKTLIGWDEILEGGLAPKAVVMSWRGEEGGIAAAKEKHNVIMTPGNPVYFDHTQSQNEDSVTIGGYNPIEKVYAYEPIPKELNDENGKYVLGAQANVWTEYMKNTKKVEYMIFPRMAALSEVLWSPKEKKNWSDFENRLMVQFKRYDLWKANYSKAYFDLKTAVMPNQNYNGVFWQLESKGENDKIIFKTGPEKSMTRTYKDPIPINFSSEFSGVITNDKDVIMGNWISQKFSFNKATGKKITLSNPASDKYPGDGAFTLVNGVQNEKGLARSREFLDFNGTNCEAIIDFGSETTINEIIIHTLEQPGSWIYFPSALDVSKSDDGITFSPFNTKVEITKSSDKSKATIKLANPVNTRYIKINILNFGEIPTGNPGAGNKAWLFVDEIEVN